MSGICTRRVISTHEFQILETLFREYAQTLGVDLSFQNFNAELGELERMYGGSTGAALVAWRGPTAVGCVGVRRLTIDTCEMKRLYVRPDARGLGVGMRLATEAVDIARALGYSRVVLDTLTTMKAAMKLYGTLGFEQTEPYYNNPLPDAVYFEKRIIL